MPRERKSKTEINAYRNSYASDHYDNIRLQTLKGDNIPGRLQAQVTAGKAPSKQAYIIAAIKKQLETDEQNKS